MLQTQAVEPATLELLRSLQSRDYLEGFYLVGGTALALYWGHRQSEDLDLFSNFDFRVDELSEKISHDYSYNIHFTAENTLKGHINQIKVDFIAHRYDYLEPQVQIDDFKLLSVQDILAMKLNAISITGQRSKDFVDIYYALKQYSIRDMLFWYKKKYRQDNASHVLKSLVYFEDVLLDDWPVMPGEPNVKWADVCEKIETEVKNAVES